ncbi:MAG: diaminopimelate epimerase [Dehalococcoidia bacterium]|nr:diaminopimelate epimerase [Dehalococcoidia bacterium]
MRFTKMHGAGNDYVLLDARGQDRDWPKLAREMCDRHYGIGADGLLLVAPSSVADIRMRMFNPDGSEAEMCGNGIRCFAKYVVERGIVAPGERALRVETGNGVLDVVPLVDGQGRVARVRVSMGEPRFGADDIPVRLPEGARGLQVNITKVPLDINKRALDIIAGYEVKLDGHSFRITCVSMGNPHAVAFVELPVGQFPLQVVGPLMEHHPMFPKRVNFHVVNVVDRGRLRARTWERGAGLTLACGTGACAIHAASRLLGLTDSMVQLEMPGGVLEVTWEGRGPVYLEGPVEEVFEGEWGE